MLSCIALSCFKEGECKNPKDIEAQLYAEFQPHIEFGSRRNQHASFGHLTGYAAKYYGYMWSKVFALDLFDTIRTHGLLNPEIGRKYVSEVIGRGGSCDPNELLKNFLGREPRAEAFYRDLGFDA
jgi:thimet oligopeptidase